MIFSPVTRLSFKEKCNISSSLIPPPDTPICGPVGEKCAPWEPSVALIVSVILSVALLALIVMGVLAYRKHKEEAAIASMHWKISGDEIMMSKDANGR